VLAWTDVVIICGTSPRGLEGAEMEPGPHIVVVEDEPALRHLLVDYLARQNFRVSGKRGR
jgi:hypothetical protein